MCLSGLARGLLSYVPRGQVTRRNGTKVLDIMCREVACHLRVHAVETCFVVNTRLTVRHVNVRIRHMSFRHVNVRVRHVFLQRICNRHAIYHL